MLTTWRISNFKSIHEPISLHLKPLTLFSGPNSSGKSTVIQSILMVAQSLGSSAWEEPLVLNGRFVQLGHLEDILHHGYSKPEIQIAFALDQADDHQLMVGALIEGMTSLPRDGSEQLQTRVRFSDVKRLRHNQEIEHIRLERDPLKLSTADIERANPAIQHHIRDGIFDYTSAQAQISEFFRPLAGEQALAASLSNFLPGRILVRVRPEVRDLTTNIEQLTNAIYALVQERGETSLYIDVSRHLTRGEKAIFEKVLTRLRPRESSSGSEDNLLDVLHEIAKSPDNFTVDACLILIRERLNHRQIGDISRRLTGALLEVQSKLLTGQRLPAQTELEVRQLPAHHSQTLDQIKLSLGKRVYYLGPLRDDPRVIYAFPPLPNQRDVGLKGEYTAAMLDTYGNQEIEYPLPLERGDEGQVRKRRGKLRDAVQTWLQRMDMATGLGTTESSKVGYHLTVQTRDLERPLDLTSVGVGVSQLLPILVSALLAQEGSLLIFEQPEVHMHPKVQSVLGDFFLGITALGRQCIVETHSEYLINRVRRRIAESKDATILDGTRIYFVERVDSSSRFQAVEPNEFGAILQWPAGFFDEAEEESSAILEASLAKQRAAWEHESHRTRQ